MWIPKPFASKEALRNTLLLIPEDKGLDGMLCEYLRFIGHLVIRKPSKGPEGEQGKDIVAVENNENNAYCSYVVKRGSLKKNLKGKYGIITQMEDALFIELEEQRYKNCKRTVVVAYNGEDGYRGAIREFEEKARELEDRLGNDRLLRPIERWNIEALTDKFYEKKDAFIQAQNAQFDIYRMAESIDCVLRFEEQVGPIIDHVDIEQENLYTPVSELLKGIRRVRYKYGDFEKNKD